MHISITTSSKISDLQTESRSINIRGSHFASCVYHKEILKAHLNHLNTVIIIVHGLRFQRHRIQR